MTEIAFHFNIPQRSRYLCQLLRKATGRGHSAVVLAPQMQHSTLLEALHTLDSEAFIPACAAGAPPAVLQRSRVVFAEAAVLPEAAEQMSHYDILVNLLDSVSQGFERYARVIELVEERADDSSREAARTRWRYYSDRGYRIERFDLRRTGGTGTARPAHSPARRQTH